MQVTGKAIIRVNGSELRTADEATLKPGGVSREPVKGSGKVHGFTETTEAPELECTVYHTADTSLADIMKITDATVIFETDTGKRFVLTGAFVTDAVSLKVKGGEVDVKMSAITCEED
ncbi:phage tail tube protein [Pseudodesulfovibrio indicus]|uniref:Phage tail protein n=1 Tax=Pseudodesulfovibrio indicus TaxID=1716143 RepID=A0A140D8Y4_9BACT|nr:phage tail tube protein [Pseudodesulfovibrio indicus]AMK09651.1 phage tail protein [Pseudodesulfovibrio indicus]TDT86397.1 tail tube protein [Pseudodesulfovibrio indicus]